MHKLLIILSLLIMAFTAGCGSDLVYSGEKKNDLPHGSGTLVYPGGSKYEGEFDKGTRSGQGTWEHSGGISYVGGWKNDLYHGQGTLTVPGRYTYDGEFFQGKKHGFGIKTRADGSIYEGSWENGLRQGEGVMLYPDGSRYEGAWENNERHGEGTYYPAEGEIISGQWERGIFMYIAVEIISLSKRELTFTAGDPPEQLNAAIFPEDATKPEIAWSTSDESVATVENGLVTAHEPGEAKIIVTALAEELKASCAVSVTAPPPPVVERITFTESTFIMDIGDEPLLLTATIQPANVSREDLNWSSSNPAVAEVDSRGVVYPRGPGETIITLSSGRVSDQCSVIVRSPSE